MRHSLRRPVRRASPCRARRRRGQLLDRPAGRAARRSRPVPQWGRRRRAGGESVVLIGASRVRVAVAGPERPSPPPPAAALSPTAATRGARPCTVHRGVRPCGRPRRSSRPVPIRLVRCGLPVGCWPASCRSLAASSSPSRCTTQCTSSSAVSASSLPWSPRSGRVSAIVGGGGVGLPTRGATSSASDVRSPRSMTRAPPTPAPHRRPWRRPCGLSPT